MDAGANTREGTQTDGDTDHCFKTNRSWRDWRSLEVGVIGAGAYVVGSEKVAKRSIFGLTTLLSAPDYIYIEVYPCCCAGRSRAKQARAPSPPPPSPSPPPSLSLLAHLFESSGLKLEVGLERFSGLLCSSQPSCALLNDRDSQSSFDVLL